MAPLASVESKSDSRNQYLESDFDSTEARGAIQAFYSGLLNAHEYRVTMESSAITPPGQPAVVDVNSWLPGISEQSLDARLVGIYSGTWRLCMTLIDTAEIGRKGGKARAENLTAEQLREIGRKGAAARWGPKKQVAKKAAKKAKK